MEPTVEQTQMRFLAVVLPGLSLCTHILLSLSFILQGAAPDHAHFSLIYNALAGSASILGFIGAIRLIPSLVSAYTFMHTATLSFVTLALVNLVVPFPFRLLNPVIPSWQLEETAICREIDAGFGADEQWLQKCAKGLTIIKFSVAGVGLALMVAQWWALLTVKRWSREIRFQRPSPITDVEKEGILHDENDLMIGRKN